MKWINYKLYKPNFFLTSVFPAIVLGGQVYFEMYWGAAFLFGIVLFGKIDILTMQLSVSSQLVKENVGE